MHSLHYRPEQLRYRAMIGTGGIGSGSFFMLKGNHTLGREESRAGHFLDRRDYCKLHIIAHYVKVFLGTGFPVYTVGRVGRDEIGTRILSEMARAGLDTRFVQIDPEASTLNAICLLYPDGSGGNLTLDNSASGRVICEDIDAADEIFSNYPGNGVVLAAPEVPLSTRRHLLEKATAHSFFRVASFVSGEMAEVRRDRLFEQVDLVGMNFDEAAALVGGVEADAPVEKTVQRVIEVSQAHHEGMIVSITAGIKGSWLWNGRRLDYTPAIPAPVASTAGAGDAHLAGLIVANILGLDHHAAAFLAGVMASISVTSPHTIHPDLDIKLLVDFCRERNLEPPFPLKPLLDG